MTTQTVPIRDNPGGGSWQVLLDGMSDSILREYIWSLYDGTRHCQVLTVVRCGLWACVLSHKTKLNYVIEYFRASQTRGRALEGRRMFFDVP